MPEKALTKRQQQALQTKQRILDAAQSLIEERGYPNITIKDIAGKADIAMGTMYHYFKSKDDLMHYFERVRFGELRNRVEAMRLTGGIQKIRYFLKGWFEDVQSDSINLSKYWHHLAVDMCLPIDNERTHLDDDVDVICGYLQESIESRELRDDTPVRSIAMDIIFSVYGASFYRCSCYQPFDLVRWGDDFLTNVFESHIAQYRCS